MHEETWASIAVAAVGISVQLLLIALGRSRAGGIDKAQLLILLEDVKRLKAVDADNIAFRATQIEVNNRHDRDIEANSDSIARIQHDVLLAQGREEGRDREQRRRDSKT